MQKLSLSHPPNAVIAEWASLLFRLLSRMLQQARTPQILSLHLLQGCHVNFSGDLAFDSYRLSVFG